MHKEAKATSTRNGVQKTVFLLWVISTKGMGTTSKVIFCPDSLIIQDYRRLKPVLFLRKTLVFKIDKIGRL